MPIPVNLAFEDTLSEAVIKKLIGSYSEQLIPANCYSKGGFGYLKGSIKGFNHAAKSIPFLVMTDLDQFECPPQLLRDWLKAPKHRNLLFWIAVRETEAWLLADREGLSKYIGIDKSRIPQDVETISNPKEFLINLARKSRKRGVREDILPKAGSTAKQGRNYNSQLIAFVNDYWNVTRATEKSASLRRAVNRLIDFEPEL